MSAVPNDPRAKEALEFLESVTSQKVEIADFHSTLKSGVALCTMLNKLKPDSIQRINTSKMAFKEMENIDAYIKACANLGVPTQYSFMTVDLYEAKNLNQVVQNLMALKRLFGFGFEKCNPANQQAKLDLSSDQTTTATSREKIHSETPIVVDQSLSKTIGVGMKAGVAELNSNVLSPECAACGLRVTSASINACSRAWHPNCFVCKRCGVKLSLTRYYEDQGKPYCEKCSFIIKPKNTTIAVHTRDMGFSFESK